MIRTTPFHERTSALNDTGLWQHWSGHLVATRYQASDKFEYFAVRNSAGIFDTSPLYKYRIAGRDSERFLSGMLARDIRSCPPGLAQYTTWLDERGRTPQRSIEVLVTCDEEVGSHSSRQLIEDSARPLAKDIISKMEIRDGWVDVGPDRFSQANSYSVFTGENNGLSNFALPGGCPAVGRAYLTEYQHLNSTAAGVRSIWKSCRRQ